MDRLIDQIIKKNNPSVVGLDPLLEYVPNFIKDDCFKEFGNSMRAAAEAVWIFNREIINEICDIVPAVKPQCAYYEALGGIGGEILYKTIDHARNNNMYVIADGKRNDIGSTAAQYAKAYLGVTDYEKSKEGAFNADALTVNGYLGSDGIMPFIDECKKYDASIFVLAKTSNPSSGEFQDLVCADGKKIYEKMADLIEKWGTDTIGKYGYSSVGAVVGATYPEELLTLRKAHKNTFFLVPGYGVQGGNGKAISNAFDEKGLGAIVNSSRAIMCAYKKEGCDEKDFAKAARREAIRMRDELNSFIKNR